MPTYEYRCQNCRHELEKVQPITADPLKECPECGEPTLKRLISGGAAVIFKGSGFYETDYRSDSYKKAAKADKEAGSGGEGGDKKADKKDGDKPAADTKSDTKKTPTTDPKPAKTTESTHLKNSPAPKT